MVHLVLLSLHDKSGFHFVVHLIFMYLRDIVWSSVKPGQLQNCKKHFCTDLSFVSAPVCAPPHRDFTYQNSLTFINTAVGIWNKASTYQQTHTLACFFSLATSSSLYYFVLFLNLLPSFVNRSLLFLPSISSLISLPTSFPALPISSLFLDGNFSPTHCHSFRYLLLFHHLSWHDHHCPLFPHLSSSLS